MIQILILMIKKSYCLSIMVTVVYIFLVLQSSYSIDFIKFRKYILLLDIHYIEFYSLNATKYSINANSLKEELCREQTDFRKMH